MCMYVCACVIIYQFPVIIKPYHCIHHCSCKPIALPLVVYPHVKDVYIVLFVLLLLRHAVAVIKTCSFSSSVLISCYLSVIVQPMYGFVYFSCTCWQHFVLATTSSKTTYLYHYSCLREGLFIYMLSIAINNAISHIPCMVSYVHLSKQ